MTLCLQPLQPFIITLKIFINVSQCTPCPVLNPACVPLSCLPVPSMVSGLQVDSQQTTSSLQVSWQQALGVADGYNLEVLDGRGELVTNSSQPYGRAQHRFDQLTPGRKYRVVVRTTSGGVFSQGVSGEARTRKHFLVPVSTFWLPYALPGSRLLIIHGRMNEFEEGTVH